MLFVVCFLLFAICAFELVDHDILDMIHKAEQDFTANSENTTENLSLNDTSTIPNASDNNSEQIQEQIKNQTENEYKINRRLMRTSNKCQICKQGFSVDRRRVSEYPQDEIRDKLFQCKESHAGMYHLDCIARQELDKEVPRCPTCFSKLDLHELKTDQYFNENGQIKFVVQDKLPFNVHAGVAQLLVMVSMMLMMMFCANLGVHAYAS